MPKRSNSKPKPEVSPELIADLRARIARIEGRGEAVGGGERTGADRVLSFGVAEIDQALPWGGLPAGRLHEITGRGQVGLGGGGAAASGFCGALLSPLVAAGGTILWCVRRRSGQAGGILHGPGLGDYGIGPDRLIVVAGDSGSDILWAMEEGLRTGALAAVVGEVRTAGLTAGRRLQLAAEAGGTPAFLLEPGGKTKSGARNASAATTRWRIEAAPSQPGQAARSQGIGELGKPRWRVQLVRCRGGAEQDWIVEWNNETHRFAVVAPVADRPLAADRGGAADEAAAGPAPRRFRKTG